MAAFAGSILVVVRSTIPVHSVVRIHYILVLPVHIFLLDDFILSFPVKFTVVTNDFNVFSSRVFAPSACETSLVPYPVSSVVSVVVGEDLRYSLWSCVAPSVCVISCF